MSDVQRLIAPHPNGVKFGRTELSISPFEISRGDLQYGHVYNMTMADSSLPIGASRRTMVMYGGVNSNGEDQVARRKVNRRRNVHAFRQVQFSFVVVTGRGWQATDCISPVFVHNFGIHLGRRLLKRRAHHQLHRKHLTCASRVRGSSQWK